MAYRSIEHECMRYKERVRMALQCKISAGEDGNGEERYVDGTADKCSRVILDAFDEMAYHWMDTNKAANALERVVLECRISMDEYYRLFIEFFQEELGKNGDGGVYKYEDDEDEEMEGDAV